MPASFAVAVRAATERCGIPSAPNALVLSRTLTGGVERFTITFTTAGTRTITVTDLSRPLIKGSTPKITVTSI